MGDLSVIFSGMAVNNNDVWKRPPLYGIWQYTQIKHACCMWMIYRSGCGSHESAYTVDTRSPPASGSDPRCYIRAKFGASAAGRTPLQVKTFAVNRCSWLLSFASVLLSINSTGGVSSYSILVYSKCHEDVANMSRGNRAFRTCQTRML